MNKNINRINIVKREEIKNIINNKEVIKYFSSIKVFGSCLTEECKESSDIDLFVTLKPEYLNKKDINDSYIALMLSSDSDKDIFYAHEQSGKNNKKLYENMLKGLEVLKENE